MKLFILFLFCLLHNGISAQIRIVDLDEYYEGDYFPSEGYCQTYDFTPDTSYINLIEYDGKKYAEVYTLPGIEKVDGVEEVDDYFVFPYDMQAKIPEQFFYKSEEEEYETFKYAESENLLDTIYFIRKQRSSYVPTNHCGQRHWVYFPIISEEEKRLYSGHGFCFKKNQELPIIIVKNPTDFAFSQRLLVEYKDGDIFSSTISREILCPKQITRSIIWQLSAKLTELGYLDKKDRMTFVPEVRDALWAFQEDNNLKVGFVDRETLLLLGITYPEPEKKCKCR